MVINNLKIQMLAGNSLKMCVGVGFEISSTLGRLNKMNFLFRVLGRELGKSYTRQQLIELIKQERIEMKDEEIEMMRGALIFKEKTVREVMTPLEDCYMLPLDTVLNFEMLTKILEFGHSRIPVYDGNRTNIGTNVKKIPFLCH